MKHIKMATLRRVTAGVFIAMTVAGLIWPLGWGTLSGWGLGSVALLCPLGVLETWVAGHSLFWKGVLAVGVFVCFVLVFGRAFCGWMCPVSLFPSRTAGQRGKTIAIVAVPAQQKTAAGKLPDSLPYYILGGALASSAVFGFPVFCLICPVGLIFGLLIALWRLVAFNDPSWTIILFAGMLFVEFVVLRRWCHQFCPLGALIRLLSRFNRTVRPQVDAQACVRSQGQPCRVCTDFCPEGIDLHQPMTAQQWAYCTKCGACAQVCPTQAIHFPFSAPTAPSQPVGVFVPPRALTLAQAQTEAQRCLACGACEAACPEHKPLTEVMNRVRVGKVRSAAQLLLAAGSFPEVCGRVCPSERLCESACAAGTGPIAIRAIERSVCDAALRRGEEPGRFRCARKWRVAVVGAGPSGMACAAALAHNGVQVHVFDRQPQIGGLMTFGIPADKLDKAVIEARRRQMQAQGVQWSVSTQVGADISYAELLDSYDALYVAVGAGLAVDAGLTPRPAVGLVSAGEFLEEQARLTLALTRPDELLLSARNRRVVVLGAGGTAMDCLQTAVLQKASSVTCVCRRARTALRVPDAQLQQLGRAGVRFLFSTRAQGLTLNLQGGVAGLTLGSTQPQEEQHGQVLEADLVIVAYGFRTQVIEPLQSLGVRFDAQGRMLTGGQLPAQTDSPRIFAGGDAVRGPACVAEAIADGRTAAASVVQYLQQEAAPCADSGR